MGDLHEHNKLTSVAAYLHHMLDICGKKQKKVAEEIGYDNPNILSMFKHGETKVPLDKIPEIAKAIYADPAHLYRLALEQYWPEHRDVINRIFGGVVTANETALLLAVREATGNHDPAFDEHQLAGAIAALLTAYPRTSR